jgi:Transposase
METQDNVQKGWRTREQKEEIIRQWQQSGKSRKVFCQEVGVTYNSLVSWCKQMKDQQASQGFTEVKIKESTGLFAQIQLPGGIKIDFFQSVPAEYLQSLIRK